MGLKRKFVEAGNLRFCYYERLPSVSSVSDSKPTTLLFVHGFTSNKESWMRITQYLPKSWRLLVLDLPGHGESGFDPKLDCSPPALADNVHQVREREGEGGKERGRGRGREREGERERGDGAGKGIGREREREREKETDKRV